VPTTGSFSSEELARELFANTAFMESRLYRAFLKDVRGVVNDPELISLLDDVRQGVYQALTPGIESRIDQINISTQDLVQIVRQSYTRAGRITTARTGVEITFDITNPRAISRARQIGGELIRNINKTTRQNIRDVIAEMLDGNVSMIAGTKMIKQQVGLLPRHAQAVRRYRQTLVSAGTTPGRADTLSNAYAERLLKYRASTIARTETARAASYGQQEAWEQMLDADVIPPDTQRVWITAQDEQECDVCGPMNGITAPLNGFWDTPAGAISQPTDSHPNCRCTSGLVFLDAIGKVDPLGYEYWLIEKKGDFPGHPFRGNQWTGGIYHGDKGKLSHRRGKEKVKTKLEMPAALPEDFTYSPMLETLAKKGNLTYLEPSNGSFYNIIEWDSSVSPNIQILNAFSAATGVTVDKKMRSVGAKQMNPETLAETLDALAFLMEDWDDGEGTFKPDVLTWSGAKSYVASVSYGSLNPGVLTLDLTAGSFSNAITDMRTEPWMASFIKNKTGVSVDEGISKDELSRVLAVVGQSDVGRDKEPFNAPSDLPPHQAVMVHEFGHIVKTRMEWRDPHWLFTIESGMIDHMRQFTGEGGGTRASLTQDYWLGDGVSSLSTPAERFVESVTRKAKRGVLHDTPFGNGSNKATLAHRPIVSTYAATNSQEFFAEMFLLSYGNRLEGLPALNAATMEFYTTSSGRVVPVGANTPVGARTFKRSDALKSIREEFMSYMDEYAGTW